jgi:hypothetical protein
MAKVKYVVVHRVDNNNVGDMASNPLQYFLSREDYHIVDVTQLGRHPYPTNVPMIVGGGGLIGNEFIGPYIEKIFVGNDKLQLRRLMEDAWQLGSPDLSEIHQSFTKEYQELIHKYLQKVSAPTSPKFLWGAGLNGDFKKDKSGKMPTPAYPGYISEFKAVGVRDYNMGHSWTPCASCMHPALRKTYAIKNDIIWFEHKKQLIKDFGTDPIPRFVNSGDNIEQTIELLGSANTILTNSYHGAYWGTLLKKKVIVVGAWSNKFLLMKHRPSFIEKPEDYKQVLEHSEIHKTALDESINATEMFWKQVRENS